MQPRLNTQNNDTLCVDVVIPAHTSNNGKEKKKTYPSTTNQGQVAQRNLRIGIPKTLILLFFLLVPPSSPSVSTTVAGRFLLLMFFSCCSHYREEYRAPGRKPTVFVPDTSRFLMYFTICIEKKKALLQRMVIMTYNLSTRTLAQICTARFRTGSGWFFLGSSFWWCFVTENVEYVWC